MPGTLNVNSVPAVGGTMPCALILIPKAYKITQGPTQTHEMKGSVLASFVSA